MHEIVSRLIRIFNHRNIHDPQSLSIGFILIVAVKATYPLRLFVKFKVFITDFNNLLIYAQVLLLLLETFNCVLTNDLLIPGKNDAIATLSQIHQL